MIPLPGEAVNIHEQRWRLYDTDVLRAGSGLRKLHSHNEGEIPQGSIQM